MSRATRDPDSTPHAFPQEDVISAFGSDAVRGLSAGEASSRLTRLGPNRIPQSPRPSALYLLLHQFHSLLIYVLIVAAMLSLALGDVLEFAAILLIALLNGVLGFVQEYRAEQALAALESMSAPNAVVLRDGAPRRVATEQIVTGDLLLLEAGDIVAADARLTDVISLAAGEALLTGESVPTTKTVDTLDADAPLAERHCMVYQGTLITRGRGRAVVVRTGAATEMGHIAGHVAAQGREQTPLQRELASVGRFLVVAAGLLCFGVFLAGIAQGIEAREMLLTAASLAVAAIPEGLPAAATVVLALGVQRMASRNAVVRRLSSVETLGSVTIVFTDKTGTLTQNSMRVEHVWLAGDERDLLRIAWGCNNASLADADAPGTGDPTEVALLEYVRRQEPHAAEVWPEARHHEIPFDAERARMTVLVPDVDGGSMALVKGSTQRVLERSSFVGDTPITDELRRDVEHQATSMARDGLRVLALAHRRLPAGVAASEDIERHLTLVGLAGMADPVRPGAADAVRRAQAAGIKVVMLTGDQRETAQSIAAALGLGGVVMTGPEIEDMELVALRRCLQEAHVFARVTSEHKLQVVRAARDEGHIVAMTGDGVNDAPALRAADIGIAMGLSGTDVAREASDLVLSDDEFGTILAAIEEGRTIHTNIRRFIHFLLSCNAAEVAVIFLALLATGDTVLTPLQILFVNLLTDGLPALALGLEPAHANVMHRPPRPPGTGLLMRRSLAPILGLGGVIAASALIAFASGGEDRASMTFATLVGAQLTASLVFRSESESLFSLQSNGWLVIAFAASIGALAAVFCIPLLRDAFDLQLLAGRQWLAVLSLSLLPLAVAELARLSGLLQRFDLIPRA
ncbi:MAG TPA: cation-translocating P-type ATPase [Dehalococcoidia bacterium]|nr:cation-translocating P-type ATPase [Dehalococcoidia bacterium]